jgi:hypothetical protein
MSSKKGFIANLESSVSEQLSSLGFAKRQSLFAKKHNDETTGLIGLMTANDRPDGLIGVSPVVHVESPRIRIELNRLLGEKPSRVQPSVSSALGYLMPERRHLEWLFDPQQALSKTEELDRMCLAVKLYSEPFYEKMSSLHALTEALERLEFSFKERAVFHLPVVYRILGAEDKARTLVTFELQRVEDHTDMGADAYRSFAENFLSPV